MVVKHKKYVLPLIEIIQCDSDVIMLSGQGVNVNGDELTTSGDYYGSWL